MREMDKLDREQLNDVAGGADILAGSADSLAGGENILIQKTSFCQKCRGAGFIVKQVEPDGSELRECKTCHQLYKYRKY